MKLSLSHSLASGRDIVAMATNNSKQQLHIAMFPWLAFGHITPFLELAKLIALKGHKVSFISAPKNIDRLPQLPPNLLPNLKLIKLPLPTVESLPKDAEATSDLPYDKVQYLKISYDGMKDSMYGFLKAESPDWVVYDFVAHWVGPIAVDLKISSAFFSIFTGAFVGFIGPGTGRSGDGKTPENLTVPPKWVNFPTTVAYRLYEVMTMIDSFTGNESATSDVERFIGSLQGNLEDLRRCYGGIGAAL